MNDNNTIVVAAAVVALAVLLLANGLLVREREPTTPADSLSLLLGDVLLAGPVVDPAPARRWGRPMASTRNPLTDQ